MAEVTTRADGGSAASQAVDLDGRSWSARPVVALVIRGLVFVVPLVGSLALTILYRALVPSPVGLQATVAWWVGAIAVVVVALKVLDRAARRLLPIAMLFRMSLVFPDRAPSRFKTALRTGTVRQLERHLEAPERGTNEATPTRAAETLLALVARLSAHDRRTRGHSERVRAYTDLIAEEMALPAESRHKLHWAALIHDIGKLQVPPKILNKPGRPTDDEWQILEAHPGAGEHLVDPLRPWLAEWARTTTQHHERYDGKGYPHGLAGTDISLAGRIVAVADAYDVMTSSRSYKRALPAAQARAELSRNAGTQFDPAVVRAFLAAGIGRTRMMVGPLAWLTELRALSQAPTAAVSTVGTFASAAVVAVGSVVAAGGPTAASLAEPIERVVTGASHPAIVGQVAYDAEPGESSPAGPPPAQLTTASPTTTMVEEGNTTTTTTPSESVADADPTTASPSTASEPSTRPSPASSTPAMSTPQAVRPTTTAAASTTTSPTPTTTSLDQPTTTTTTATTTTSTTTTAPPEPSGPFALDDYATVGQSSEYIDVTANDSPNGFAINEDSLSITIPPTHGTAIVISNGYIRYNADDDYDGPDTLTYQICDLGGGCSQAIVSITVEGGDEDGDEDGDGD